MAKKTDDLKSLLTTLEETAAAQRATIIELRKDNDRLTAHLVHCMKYIEDYYGTCQQTKDAHRLINEIEDKKGKNNV